MSDAAMTAITFEEGYDELKQIVARLDEEEITVHEMCEQFARGKGLEKALRGYLDEKQGQLQEIEEGRRVPEFRVVAPSGGADPQKEPPAAPVSNTGADDDIPF